MDKAITALNSQLKTLSFRVKKTDEIINKSDREASERQKTSLTNIRTAVTSLKESIEEKKFAKGDTEEEVCEWGEEVDDLLAQADDCSRRITKQLEDMDRTVRETKAIQEHQQATEFERTLTEQKLKQQQEADEKARAEQFEFEKKKLELELKYRQEKQKESGATASVAKMPKLVISKFDGTPQDWVRFLGQFQAQIDETSSAAVTKFSYLKELVEVKVRKLIDGLPFTEDGYHKATTLLEKRYGRISEVVGAYVRNILELPVIQVRDVARIHEFYEKLLFNVESLQTLGNLNKLDAAVRFTFDKLAVVKHELALIDENWSDWTFKEFLEALEKWTINNPILEERTTPPTTTSNRRPDRSRVFYAAKRDDGQQSPRGCVYCDSTDHRTFNCDKVLNVGERKRILAEKRLCFNCTGAKHHAAVCKSKATCQNCQSKHHTSICDKSQIACAQTREPGMTANHVGKSAVIHPVVVVKINGFKFRALLDSGASHSYASSTAIRLINAHPKSTGLRQIAMLMGVTTRTMQVFEVVMGAITSDFQLKVNVTKVEKRELLTLENPHYKQVLGEHPHLRGVQMDDDDEKGQLPIHLILGANDFAKIRTGERLRVGRRGDPVGEFTRFGWALMAPGAESDLSPACLAINSTVDYEQLCALDVLGLADTPTGDQGDVYAEFKEQLTRSPDGWYETGLPWKGNCPSLPNNCDGSVRRLNSLLRKLRKTNMLAEYDAVIREQLEEGVVEKAPTEVVKGKEFYLPHRAVVRKSAETTKLRVVYDASARERDDVPSLNECLHTGPPLQNQLWNVITRNRFHPVAVAGDIRRAFLQVRIREAERDALRFHWLADINATEIETLRFTRVLFGLARSPFLLNGVIQQHLENWQVLPESVNEIRRSLYVDDLISGASTKYEAKQLKREAVEIFADAKFELHSGIQM